MSGWEGKEAELRAIVGEAVARAQAEGKDHVDQVGAAVRALKQARPDWTASEAMHTALQLMR